jgi:hypothetical protein
MSDTSGPGVAEPRCATRGWLISFRAADSDTLWEACAWWLPGSASAGAAFVTGGVGPDNAAARSFYENAGFRPTELRLVADVATVEDRLGGSRGSSQRSAP